MRGPSAVRVRFLALMISSTSSLVISLIGRSRPCGDEGGAEVALGNLAAAAPVASLSAMKASAALPNECWMRSARSRAAFATASASITGRVDALVDLAAPFAGGAPRVLQRDRAIDADDAPGRCCARRNRAYRMKVIFRPCRAAPGRRPWCR